MVAVTGISAAVYPAPALVTSILVISISVTVAAAPAPPPPVNPIAGFDVPNPEPTESTSILVTIISVIVIAAPTPPSVFVDTLGICVYPLPTFVIVIKLIAPVVKLTPKNHCCSHSTTYWRIDCNCCITIIISSTTINLNISITNSKTNQSYWCDSGCLIICNCWRYVYAAPA